MATSKGGKSMAAGQAKASPKKPAKAGAVPPAFMKGAKKATKKAAPKGGKGKGGY